MSNFKLKCEIYELYDLYYKIIDRDEIKWINKIEMLDEFEELNLMFKHYFLFLAKKLD